LTNGLKQTKKPLAKHKQNPPFYIEGKTMLKEYFITYLHQNGHLIRKQLNELDLDELYESDFVKEIVAKTEIDFDNFEKSLEEHIKKEQAYIKSLKEKSSKN